MTVVLGFILDLLFGDPENFPHPVRFIGMMIDKGEMFLRSCISKFVKTDNEEKFERAEFIAGIVLSVFVTSVSLIIPTLILYYAGQFNKYLKFGLEAFFCYQILAVKSLKKSSYEVYTDLKKDDIEGARQSLSKIVGRDTEDLEKNDIIKATVETVAENTSDGAIAPLLFLAIGGAPLGFLYKAVNTLDSMIGYKNQDYYFFGKFAAKLDDILNYVPARIAAFQMLFISFIFGYDVSSGLRVYFRDNNKHASPNSAHTEAVCAGVLNIQLGGDAYYFGELYEKPTIGNDIRPVEIKDIKRANKLLYGTAICSLVIFMLIRIGAEGAFR